MEDGKRDESGFVLLYSLGAIILIAVLIGGIFLLSRVVFLQVEKVDQFKRIKEVEEYALQDGSNQIGQQIDTYLSELETIDFGEDITFLSSEMDRLFTHFFLSTEGIGSENQFSYIVKIKNIQKEKVTPYVLVQSDGSFGWEKDSSIMNTTKATNAQFTFELEAEVSETQKNGQQQLATAKSNFIYEIQWNDVDIADELTELDVWRNVVYSHYLPNGARYLSADEWMRKMDAIYRYNSQHTTFDFTGYDNQLVHTTGYGNGQVYDVTDGTLLDFSNSGKVIRSDLTFEGSFLLENGVQLEGSNAASRLIVNNLLVLRNGGYPKNFVQDLNVIAGNGLYIDLAGQDSYLAINEKEQAIQTSGLLVNHTQASDDNSSGGLLFGSGQLLVETQASSNSFSFANYVSQATQKSPQDGSWNEFLKGSMIIASSSFYAGPLNVSNDIQATENDLRSIMVDGNFMLTNAMLNSETGEKDFSYFQEKNGESIPHTPAILTLDGKNTILKVRGKSFIDAPKSSRRKSPTEESGDSEQMKFYGSKEDWNSIYLKNGAVLELGYTGVEPFNLNLDKEAIFSLKVLPELAFFDPTFLVNSVSESHLNGKVILHTFSQKDAELLKEELEKWRLPVTIETDAGKAKNGEITIVKPENPAGSDTSQIISRTFNYVEEVHY